MNLEVDLLGKYVERLVGAAGWDHRGSGHDRDTGFERPDVDGSGFATDRGGDRRTIRAGPHGRRRRHAGPRERGRPRAWPPSTSRPRPINFMATHGRGLICLALDRRSAATSSGCDMMVAHNEAPLRHGLHGHDRGAATASRPASRPPTAPHTIQVAVDPGHAGRATWSQPGHIFPLRATPGRRAGADGPDRGRRRPGAARRAARRPASSARS